MEAGVRRDPSGRFVVRLSPGLHASLRETARREGVSLNELCVRRLSMNEAGAGAQDGLASIVRRASDILGGDLVGLAIFGSWARGEAGPSSDVDALIVVSPGVPVRRALYQAWDSSPVLLDGHRVEPQFVRLPDPGQVVAGIWGEVAIDGVVVFERALEVSRRLAMVRRDVVSGRIERRVAHGQAYWAVNDEAA